MQSAVQKYDLSLVKERPNIAQKNSEKQVEDHGPGSLQHYRADSCHSFQWIMDGLYYIPILQEHLFRGARKQIGPQWRFQQGNNPKHTSRAAKEFLDHM
jgi:hypothetical protein